MDMFGVAVLIFLVTDPFGNIAVFLAALKGVAPGRRLRVAFRELAFALGLLLLFLTAGEPVPSRRNVRWSPFRPLPGGPGRRAWLDTAPGRHAAIRRQ